MRRLLKKEDIIGNESEKAAKKARPPEKAMKQAEQTLAREGRITVVVQDNGSLHTSLLVRQQRERWQQQGLYIFFPLLFRNEPH